MKKKRILLAVFLCIPAIIAIFAIIRFNSDSISQNDLLSVSVETKSGSDEMKDAEDISFFASVLDSSTAIDAAANPLSDYTAVEITYVKLAKEFKYTYYLSSSPDDCLYADPDGKLHRINSEIARSLLSRPEMQDVYNSSEVPRMTLTSGEEISCNPSPSKTDWNYKNVDGEFVNISDSGEDSERYTLSKSGLLGMSFSVEPDTCLITIQNGTKTVFDGDISTLSNFTFENDCNLTMTVKASWLKDDFSDDTELYGELDYLINVFYDVPASCTVSESETNPGELLFVRVDNAMNEDYEISATFKTADSLHFYEHNGGKIALVPVAMTAEPGSYTIEIKSEKSNDSLPVTVTAKNFSTVNYNSSAAGIDSASFVSKATSAEKAFAEYASKASDELFVKTKLSDPLGSAENWICARFGANVTANGEQTDLRQNGIGYAVDAGTTVYCPAGGKVLFSGSTSLYGNVVIIEHGFGLQSSYFYLGDVTVSAGDTVSADQILGKVAEAGVNSGYTSMQFNVSVGGIYVNPASVLYSAYDFFNITSVTENLLGVDPNAIISSSR